MIENYIHLLHPPDGLLGEIDGSVPNKEMLFKRCQQHLALALDNRFIDNLLILWAEPEDYIMENLSGPYQKTLNLRSLQWLLIQIGHHHVLQNHRSITVFGIVLICLDHNLQAYEFKSHNYQWNLGV